ncbi:response regulator transcription factor [Paenibacillus physcomitrellae]|uniref:DNA-binding response regulator n=1 Tax=Paenibacillus physcomitrellae TaxID=1619311 RepID=A0ABQ1FZ70_9BACL|nr:response regulator transcription factor [Paenibacillus physcomitrellae]GGA33220.1 DNA-binding response regulator [Paenibacillus physcomitrellae]
MPIQVIVVDPYQLVRRGITSILEGEPNIEVCGEAADRKEALELIKRLDPHICIMNNRINQQSGLDVIDKLKYEGADCRFIYLTSSMKPSEIQQAIMLGVEGIIPKEAQPEELLFAVGMVGRGRKYYDYELVEAKLLEGFQKNDSHLTPKETEVLQMLSEGLSNKEIASRLFITDYTVKKHVSQILAKLDLPDRTKAALYYHNKGLRENILV